jgi:hypothetical protein
MTDFYQPLFAPNRSQEHYMRVSHVITAVWGAVQIAAALFVITCNSSISMVILGLEREGRSSSAHKPQDRSLKIMGHSRVTAN